MKANSLFSVFTASDSIDGSSVQERVRAQGNIQLLGMMLCHANSHLLLILLVIPNDCCEFMYIGRKGTNDL